MKQHIIYIPGLGDGYDPIRKAGLFFWKRPSIAVTHIPMHWLSSNESYEAKLSRIKKAIDTHPDRKTILVGESAGGAMAIVAAHRFAENVERTVTVCGMNQGQKNVNPKLYDKNHAFQSVMQEVDTIVPALTEQEKLSMMILFSSLDYTVRPKNTLIDGVESYDLKTAGHMTSILSVLFWNYRIIYKKT